MPEAARRTHIDSEHKVKPVFIVSLPRSGSTMLQKMLAVSPEVHTVSEPWICLPLAAMTEPTAIVAEYWQRTSFEAVDDLIEELPGGSTEYHSYIERFVTSIYDSIASHTGATLFIDKTPRYYLILKFLMRAFPAAKFVLLYRDPLAVFSSILKTWCSDRISLRLRQSYVDLMHGPKLMAEGATLLSARAMCVHYTDLVSEPEKVVPQICDFLGVGYSVSMLSDYRSVSLNGRMGDPTGFKLYPKVSPEPIDSWKKYPINIYRKAFFRYYVRFLGEETLRAFGQSKQSLIDDLNSAPTSFGGAVSDLSGHILVTIWRLVNHFSTGVGRFRKERRRPYVPYG